MRVRESSARILQVGVVLRCTYIWRWFWGFSRGGERGWWLRMADGHAVTCKVALVIQTLSRVFLGSFAAAMIDR